MIFELIKVTFLIILRILQKNLFWILFSFSYCFSSNLKSAKKIAPILTTRNLLSQKDKISSKTLASAWLQSDYCKLKRKCIWIQFPLHCRKRTWLQLQLQSVKSNQLLVYLSTFLKKELITQVNTSIVKQFIHFYYMFS